MQTESLIKRFGLDDRLFTREVNGVSVDAPKFSGVKRTYNQIANTDVQQTQQVKVIEAKVVEDKDEIDLDI